MPTTLLQAPLDFQTFLRPYLINKLTSESNVSPEILGHLF
jgi:hypothetical protein